MVQRSVLLQLSQLSLQLESELWLVKQSVVKLLLLLLESQKAQQSLKQPALVQEQVEVWRRCLRRCLRWCQ